jgi:DegV family protein with EDD domain
MNFKIISDSTCDLPKELLEQHNITLVPLSVVKDEKAYKDGLEITPADIFAHVANGGQLCTTAANSLGEYMDEFAKYSSEYDGVIHINISSEFSSCYQNACLAAQEFDNVRVVDSRNLSTGQGLTVLKAAEIAMADASVEEILRTCEDMIPHVEASFVANSIDYLYKGGRCSALAALGANMLQIKPCIEVRDGKMIPGKKYRGSIEKVIRSYVIDKLKNRTDIDDERIFVTHTRCDPETIEAVRSLIRQYHPGFREILETTAGATNTTHCGPETLGIMFVRKKPDTNL